ncbi:MAG: PaaI family thioesterase [Pseudomonadota bacterium]
MSAETPLAPGQQAFFDALRAGDWELPPGIAAAGIRPDLWLKEVSKGRVYYEWPNDGSHDITPGRVFGGWVGALSDHIVSMCMASALEDGEWFTTLDLQIKLFRPVAGEIIPIEANLVNRSRTTGYVEAEWRLPNDKLAVKVVTWKAIRPAEELGR